MGWTKTLQILLINIDIEELNGNFEIRKRYCFIINLGIFLKYVRCKMMKLGSY